MFAKTRERKFKAFLLIFISTTALCACGIIDQDTYKGLAIFCGSFYAGSNVISKVVGIWDVKKAA
jgi:hypothetical protein